jgi:hypothetical protein
MNRLTRNGWTWSQLLEEWNYRRDERLGILCGSTEPEPWMIEMAEKEATEAIEQIVKGASAQGELIQ